MTTSRHPVSIKTDRWMLLAAGCLFLLSGASSLVYEVTWIKVLTLQFGSSAWSISTVVASFMGGLGAGSAWAGRRADRIRRPLRLYGFLELGIAAFGLISLPILGNLGDLLTFYYELGFGWFSTARLVLSFTVLLVPTALMGASLPVLVVGLAGDQTFDKRVAVLYGINTLGAALGAALAGLYALPTFGVSGTTTAAAMLGLGVTAGAFLLDRRALPCTNPRETLALPAPAGETEPLTSTAAASTPPRLLLGAVTLAGTLGVFYQIAWTRLLIPVVGSSTYAFTIILTTFLVGIGIGGLVAALPIVQRRSYITAVGVSMALTSASVLLGLYFVNQLPQMFFGMLKGSGANTSMLLLSQAALAGSIVLAPTCFMGAALPLAISGRRAQSHVSGTAVGGLYAANTVGSIFGSVLAGFMVLPWIGAAPSIRLASVVGLVMATALVLSDGPVSWKRRAGCSAALGLILTTLLITSPTIDLQNLHRGTFRSVQAEETLSELTGDLLYAREGRNASVTIERTAQSTILRVNGKPDASTRGDLLTQYVVGHLPLFLHEQPEDLCIVGFGSGATAYATTTHPTVSAVDLVEIEEAVLDGSTYFDSVNYGVTGDPRVRVHVEDGRSFLRYREKQYDVIISAPSNPWMAGVSSLFSSEFYRLARSRLNSGGIICQWIQFYELSSETLQVMLNTLAAEFPHVLVFFVKADLVCIASETPITGDPARFTERFSIPHVRDSLARVGVNSPFDLLCTVLWNFPHNFEFFRSRIKNTDNNLWLEYRAPIEMYQDADVPLRWVAPAQYLSNLQRLFPGVERERLALQAARSLAHQLPDVAMVIEDLAVEFKANSELSEELTRVAQIARRLHKEKDAYDSRMKVIRQLLENHRFQEVIPLAKRVLESKPRDNLAHRVLGWALVSTGEVGEGVKHYVKAIEIQPDDYEARASLAALLFSVGAQDEDGHLRRSLELNPYFVPAWRIRIQNLTTRNQFEEARVALREAERTLPADRFQELEGSVASLFPPRVR